MKSEVAQSCPTLCNPVDCSLPGSSIHGIFQARVLEWGAISFSRGSSWPGDWTWVTHYRQTFYHLSHQRSQESIKESSILRWNNLYVEFGQALLEIKQEIKYTFSVMQRLRPPWWLSQWRVCLQSRRSGFNPWVGKIPWRREWQPILIFLPGEIPWTEEPVLRGTPLWQSS